MIIKIKQEIDVIANGEYKEIGKSMNHDKCYKICQYNNKIFLYTWGSTTLSVDYATHLQTIL